MANLSNNRVFGILSTIAVIIGIGTGFWLLGSPQQQRIQDLRQIAQFLHRQAEQDNESLDLPDSLPSRMRRLTDPISGKPYRYQKIDQTHYKLCANFATDSDQNKLQNKSRPRQDFWEHPAGKHCFEINVLEEAPFYD